MHRKVSKIRRASHILVVVLFICQYIFSNSTSGKLHLLIHVLFAGMALSLLSPPLTTLGLELYSQAGGLSCTLSSTRPLCSAHSKEKL